MKYVIAETVNDGDVAIIFPRHIDHNIMASRIVGYRKAKGAGFIQFRVNEEGNPVPVCYGKSISLNVVSRKEDSDYIQRELNRGEW